jgi:hypothetical protein
MFLQELIVLKNGQYLLWEMRKFLFLILQFLHSNQHMVEDKRFTIVLNEFLIEIVHVILKSIKNVLMLSIDLLSVKDESD